MSASAAAGLADWRSSRPYHWTKRSSLATLGPNTGSDSACPHPCSIEARYASNDSASVPCWIVRSDRSPRVRAVQHEGGRSLGERRGEEDVRAAPLPTNRRSRPAGCPPHPSPPECRPSVPRASGVHPPARGRTVPFPACRSGSAARRTPGAGRSGQGTALPRPPRGSTRTRARRRGRAGRLRGPGTRCGRRRSSRTASRTPRPAACTCASRGVNDLPVGAAARVRAG